MAISRNHLFILSLIFINLVVPLHSMESRLTDEQKSQLLRYFATSFLPQKRMRPASTVHTMTFSPNPQKLMMGSLDGIVEVDLQTEQTTKLDARIQSLHAYSPDYTKVAFVSRFHDVRIGDSLENIHTSFSEKSRIVSMAFSPDNTLFACGLANNSVVICNLETNERKVVSHEPVCPEDGNRYPIYSLTFSPDGTQLVSGANNGLLLWDIAQGTCLQLCYGSRIEAVAFRPQTNEFVTGHSNGVLRVWDFEKQRCKQSFDVGKSIESLAFTADGKWLVIGDSAALRLCNCQTKMSTVLNFENFDYDSSVSLIALSPDGNDLVTNSFACYVVRDLRGFYKLSEKLEKNDISDEELVLFKKYANDPQFHRVMEHNEWKKLCKEPDDSEGWRKFRELKHAEGQQWSKFNAIMAAFNQQ